MLNGAAAYSRESADSDFNSNREYALTLGATAVYKVPLEMAMNPSLPWTTALSGTAILGFGLETSRALAPIGRDDRPWTLPALSIPLGL